MKKKKKVKRGKKKKKKKKEIGKRKKKEKVGHAGRAAFVWTMGHRQSPNTAAVDWVRGKNPSA